MIAKAKAISYGINDLRYITGESKHKKHPEKIYRVLDNLLPPELDATGIWNSMERAVLLFLPLFLKEAMKNRQVFSSTR